MNDAPAEIGGYRVQRVLGEGGQGTVYAALQSRPRRTVAIKVIREGRAGAAAVRHLQRQAQIMARLRHPGIVQVFEAGQEAVDGEPAGFLVMEYVPRARTVLEHVKAAGLDHAARLRLFIRIAGAVDHAHRRKIIHHALRPGNVLIDERGQPKVINFGDPVARDDRDPGSLDYVSPEQLDPSPRDLSVRCDVYALGVILFEMLTDARPYELAGLSPDTALDVIRDNEPVRPSTLAAGISAPLESVILRALSTSPAQRYPTAGELAKAVHQFLETGDEGRRKPVAVAEPAPAASERDPGARARLGPALLITVAVLAVVGVAVSLTRDAWWKPAPALPQPAPPDPGPAVDPGATVAPPPPPSMFPLTAHTGDVVGMSFAPGGDLLATGASDRTFVLFDLDTREPRLTLEDLRPETAAVFTADGTKMLVAAEDAAELRDTESGRVIDAWSSDERTIRSIDLTDDGAVAAVALDDLTVRLVELASGDERVFRGTTGAFRCVAVDATARRLAAGSEGGLVSVWDPEAGTRAARLAVSDVAIVAVSVADDGTVAAIARDGEAIIHANGVTVPFDAAAGRIVAAAFDRSGRWLLAAQRDSLHLWELADPPRQAWRQVRTGDVHGVAIETGGTRCAVGGAGTVWIQPVR